MSTLTKIKAIKAVAEKTGVSQEKTKSVIETFLSEVQNTLAAGGRVEFRGFGIWEVRLSSARIGRNPSNPSAGAIAIPARQMLRFKVGKDLKSAVQGSPPST